MAVSNLSFGEISGKIKTVEQLLNLPNRQFIRAAFVCLLKREPDKLSADAFCQQLARGEPKISILYQIAQSAEGQTYSIELIGLASAIKLFRMRDGTALNRWRFRGNADTGRAPAIRAARSLKNRIEQLEENFGLTIAQLEADYRRGRDAVDYHEMHGENQVKNGVPVIAYQAIRPRELSETRDIDLPHRNTLEMHKLKF